MAHVCHMTSVHKSLDTRIFMKECRSLVKAGHAVSLVAEGETRIVDGVAILGYGEKPHSRVKRMTETAKRVYEIACSTQADVFHFHDPELIPYAVRLSKKGHCVVFDCHENHESLLQEKEWIPKLFRKPLSAIWKRYYKRCTKKFDAVVTVDPNLAAQFDQCTTVEVIANYPLANRKARGTEIPANPCDHIGPVRLVFAGGIARQWSHEEIIRAIDGVPNVEYELCGPIVDKSYFDGLALLPGSEKVNYHGEIPYENVQKLLEQCDLGMALLKPSLNTNGHKGTLGNTKLFEMMAAGLPLVCTRFEQWECIVSDRCGVCVDPDNVSEIAEAILNFSLHKERRVAAGNAAIALFEHEYNWKIEEAKLVRLYDRLLSTD